MSQLEATQLLALTYGQSIAVLVGAMVVTVVATAALETYTPTPRRRTSRLTLPRRVEGEVEDLPSMETVRSEYDRHLADVLATKPSVLLRPGPGGPEPVTRIGTGGFEAVVASAGVEEELDQGPPTEEVRIVFGPAWATTEDVEPAARAVIRSLVSARMTKPQEWDRSELRLRLPDQVTGPESFREDEFTAALDRIDTISAGEPARLSDGEKRGQTPAGVGSSDRLEGSTTVFVLRPELPDAPEVELGDAGRDRELAGVFFAAYVAAGGRERNRVTGWVAALDTAPSLPEISPQERLRGRPGKVAKLLACADEGRNWVTLDERTDIRRGLTSRAPVDPILKGVVWWWFMSTDDSARVPAEHVGVMRRGLESISVPMDSHPYAPILGRVVEACRVAEDSRVGLRLETVWAAAVSDRPATGRRSPADGGFHSDEPVAVAS